MKIPTRLLLTVAAGACTAGAACWFWPATSRSEPPLTQDAYVWQRRWSPAVKEAIEHASSLSTLCILADEIDRTKGLISDSPAPKWQDIRAVRDHVAVSWRVTEKVLKNGWTPEVTEALDTRFTRTLEDAGLAGLRITEAQCDCDCPTRLISGYADFLSHLKRTHPTLRWTFTALPAWLSSPTFRRMASASDGFVLQVHWLHRNAAAKPELMSVSETRAAIAKASAFGIPFRVALGTYGSAVVVDEQGRWRDVISEEDHAPPPGAKLIEVSSSVEDAVALLTEWKIRRPPWMTGIIWYRLPVKGDQRNWSWPQLLAVISGKELKVEWRAHSQPARDGHDDIILLNAGTRDANLPKHISLDADAVIAADGVMGYQCERTSQSVTFARNSDRWLQAGQSVIIGWMRRSTPSGSSTFSISP